MHDASFLRSLRRVCRPLFCGCLVFSAVVALAACIASASASEQAACGDPAGCSGTPVADPLRGDTTCAYGTYGCNRCVPDVPRAFVEEASGSRDLRHRFSFSPKDRSEEGLNPDRFAGLFRDHFQGIARIPGLARENWIALTRNARDVGDAAFYLTWFEKVTSDGDAWKWADRPAGSEPTARRYHYYRMPRYNHAGGVQALGPMLFVAGDCDAGNTCDAGVHVFDVRDPSQAAQVTELILDGSHDELVQDGVRYSSRAAAVAATRLEDGSYLLFVRGREYEDDGWFFRSNGVGLDPTTSFELLDFFLGSDLPPDTPWYAWENVNFVTDCSNGGLYMVAMGTRDERSFLYRVTQSVDPEGEGTRFGFEFVAKRGLNTSGLTITTRAAAGVHVTPSGNLVSYVTGRTPSAGIDEFRYHRRAD